MTDVLPRLDGAFDGSDRRTLDRRQLLKAGAWAAPVIVLATAAPAAATSPTDANTPWNSTVLTSSLWGLTVGGNPNNTQYFSGIDGNAYPAIKGKQGAPAVNSIVLTITVPKAGMRAEKPTVRADSPGWSPSTPGYVEHADTIDYVFLWSGAQAAQSYHQFRLNFTLPGAGVGTLPSAVLPKKVSMIATSQQILGTTSGSATVSP